MNEQRLREIEKWHDKREYWIPNGTDGQAIDSHIRWLISELRRLRECVRVRDEWIASMNGCWADCPHSALEADSCPTVTHPPDCPLPEPNEHMDATCEYLRPAVLKQYGRGTK